MDGHPVAGGMSDYVRGSSGVYVSKFQARSDNYGRLDSDMSGRRVGIPAIDRPSDKRKNLIEREPIADIRYAGRLFIRHIFSKQRGLMEN